MTEFSFSRWLDEMCDACGEIRWDCVCPPGCDCDDEEEDY